MLEQTRCIALQGVPPACAGPLSDALASLGYSCTRPADAQLTLCWLGPDLLEQFALNPAHPQWRQACVVLVSDEALDQQGSRNWPEHWHWAPWPLNNKRLRHYLSLAAPQTSAAGAADSGQSDWSSVGPQLLQALRAAGMFEFDYDLATGSRQPNPRHQFDELKAPQSIDDMIELVVVDDRAIVTEAFERSRLAGTDFRLTVRTHIVGAQARWVRSIGKVVDRTASHPGRLIGVSWDAHEEHQAKQSAVLAKQRLAETLTIGGMYSWDWSVDNADRVLSGVGMSDIAADTTRLDELIDPEDREADAMRFRVAIERGERYRSEVRLNLSARNHRRMLLSGAPTKVASGVTLAMRGVAVDVTDQHALEEELADARALLVESLEAGQMYCWEWDLRNGSVRTLGPCRDILGVNPANPAHMQSLIHPQDEAKNCRLLMTALRNGTAFEHEFRIVRADGQTRWISTRANPIVDDKGRLLRLIGTSLDATDRRRANDELDAAQRRLNDALDAARLNPWSVDLRTSRSAAGPRDKEMFGREVTSNAILDSLILPEDRALTEQMRSPEFLASGESIHVEFRIKRDDGQIRWISCYAKSVLGEDGEPVSLAGVSQDISEARQAQEQLAQTLIQLDRVQSATNVVLWEWSRSAGVVCYASGGSSLTGGDLPQLHRDDRWRVARRILHCGASDDVLDEEVRVENRVGGYFWVNLQGRRTEFRSDGSAVVSGVMIDISARKNDRERARKAEERLRRALEAANMRCWDWQTDLREADLDLLKSYTPTVLQSEGAAPSRVHPDDQDRHRQSIADALQGTAKDYRCEFRVLQPDGNTIWLLSLGRQVRDSDSGRISLTGVAIDITAQKALEGRLQQSQQWQRIAVDAAQLSLTLVDTVTHQRIGGERDQALFDRLPTKYDDLAAWIHPEDLPAVQAAWEDCVANGNDYNVDYRLHPDNGPLRWLRVRAKRIQDAVTGHHMVVGATRDVTEEFLAQSELEDAVATAREASAAKSAFLASVSHELRTPLNAVVGYANLLNGAGLGQTQQSHLEILKASSGQLLELVNDVLDISRIEAGELILEQVPFSLHECLESALQVVATEAESKGLCLLMTSNEIDQPQVIGDPTRLRQILVNVLGNAVKFTADGEVKVGLLSNLVDEQITVRCLVRDTGIGMSEEVRQRIFRPFRQGDVSTTRQYGGTGLGLSICRHLVDAMGGQLDCQSEPGVGTVFEIQLSLPVAVRAVKPEPLGIDALRVAVVAKSAALQRALRYQLSQFGIQTVEIAPVNCVQELQQESARFDALIVGSQAVSRLDTIKCWPRDAKSAPTAVVVLSSMSETSLPWQGQHGQRYIPISRTLRPRALAHALQQVVAAPELPLPKTSPSPSPAVSSLIGLRVLVVEDNEINRTLIELQVQVLGASPTCVEGGAQALELIADTDFDVVLMDIEMPGMDGMQTATRIRSRLGDNRLRPYIIAVTAHVLSGVREQVEAAGMDDFVSKPVEMENIRDALLRAVADADRDSEQRPSRLIGSPQCLRIR